MVTLKDIAREAGVSVMTVSRVVNERYSEVSEENIRKIQEIIQKLGYVPNYSARSLSSKSSRIISIIVHGKTNPMESTYNAYMVGQIILGVQAQGYNAMVHFIEDYSDVTRHLQSWKSEGAIFLGTFDENIRQIQESNKIPLVFTDSYSSVRQVINIGIDDYKGGVLAAEHFIQNGHTSFAFASPHLHCSQVVQQRLKGFQDALVHSGFSLFPEHIIDTLEASDCAERLLSLKKPISAIFAPMDTYAAELIIILKRKGFRIPENYSIIGFDNFPVCNYVEPGLTTISQDIDQKARYAVDILFHHLEDRTLPTQHLVLDVKLIQRNSVACRNNE